MHLLLWFHPGGTQQPPLNRSINTKPGKAGFPFLHKAQIANRISGKVAGKKDKNRGGL